MTMEEKVKDDMKRLEKAFGKKKACLIRNLVLSWILKYEEIKAENRRKNDVL